MAGKRRWELVADMCKGTDRGCRKYCGALFSVTGVEKSLVLWYSAVGMLVGLVRMGRFQEDELSGTSFCHQHRYFAYSVLMFYSVVRSVNSIPRQLGLRLWAAFQPD